MSRVIRITVFLLALAGFNLFAVEGKLYLSLAVNIKDQLELLLPKTPCFIPEVREVQAGQKFNGYLYVSKMAVKEQKAEIVCTFFVEDPSGKRTLLKNYPQALVGVKKIGNALVGLIVSFEYSFPANSSPGEYRFGATLVDKLDGTTVEAASASLWLNRKTVDTVPMRDFNELDRFLAGYYLKPSPHLVNEAFRFYLRIEPELQKKNASYRNFAQLAAFAELYRLNPHLVGELPSIAAELSPERRYEVAMIIAALGIEADGQLYGNLDEVTRKSIGNYLVNNPILVKNAVKPIQLGILWSRFFITGQLSVLTPIVEQLDKGTDILTPIEASVIGEKNLTVEQRKQLLNYLMLLETDASLSLWSQKHPLVLRYMESMLAGRKVKSAQARYLMSRMLHNVRIKLIKQQQSTLSQNNK